MKERKNMATWDAQSIAVVIGASAAALSGVIAAIRLSRCTQVDCLCFHVRREVPSADDTKQPEAPVRTVSAGSELNATQALV
jgi:hypothetical protein